MLKKNVALRDRPRNGVGYYTNSQTGFTLLELIISIAILSAVLVTIYATLSMGSRTWDKGERDIEKVQRMRVVMDLLSREIKAAYPYRVTPSELDTHKEFYAFDGKNDYLSFVSCVPLRGGTGKLSWLTFWVEEGQGLVVVERDALRSDIFKERETIDKDEMVVLDAAVTDIQFEYYRSEEGDVEEAAEEEESWEEKWDAEEEGTLPQAVSVSVTFLEEPAGQGGGDESYTRDLVIPLMIAAADRSSSRGLAGEENMMGEGRDMPPEGGGGRFADQKSGKPGGKGSGGGVKSPDKPPRFSKNKKSGKYNK
jgi:prepilin-type N-terminal cleavage/methylation domain-containing protein